ncbi:TetR/AcrR family transcriptional regulator [Tsukamurella soli]
MHIVVSREDYFAAARTVLATEGVSKLKIGTLCSALNVTSGSFYGYFGSLQGFIDEFLLDWEAAQAERIARQAETEGDDLGGIRGLGALLYALPHEAEAAIRSWAHINEAVAQVQERMDARRKAVLIERMAPIVGLERAHRLAVVAMTMVIGLQQWRRPVTVADCDLLLMEFEMLLDGEPRSPTTALVNSECNEVYVTSWAGAAGQDRGSEQ